MKILMSTFIVCSILFIAACGNDNKNSEISSHCLNLKYEECFKDKLCEMVGDVCTDKLPDKFVLIPSGVDKNLLSKKITALGFLERKAYIGTDQGLNIWDPDETKKIEDFSNGKDELKGIKYIRAIGVSSFSRQVWVAVGKSAAPNDADSKILYEAIDGKTETRGSKPYDPLYVTSIFETSPGVLGFGGAGKFIHSDRTGALFISASLTHVTSGIFSPNGRVTWLGTGGNDLAQQQGILVYASDFTGTVPKMNAKPSAWSSSSQEPNANISSMVLLDDKYVLVGLRKEVGNANSGGLAVIDIYRSGRNKKPFLLGTDVKMIGHGHFRYGDVHSLKKKELVVLGTDQGLLSMSDFRDPGEAPLEMSFLPIDKNPQGQSVDTGEITAIAKRDSSQFWVGTNEGLFILNCQ